MDLPIILGISEQAETRQLLENAVPASTVLRTAHTMAEGLRLWRDLSPVLVICEGTPQTLAPVFEQARRRMPSIPILVIGKRDSVKDAVAVMRAGAADYVTWPLRPEDLRATIVPLIHQPTLPPSPAVASDRFAHIVSLSPQMNLIKQLAKEVAVTDATVLITGESGTGKELFAQAIHAASPRARGPLVALNCAGIPENLLEAELFGYRQGAFTDAKHTKPGRFQQAEGGTLFLDEIGEMSSAAQAKLLRVLEDHTVDPLGDTHSHTVSIRVIAATNEDLLAHIKAGRFRLDLYYRLNVYQLRIPPLRERPEDLAPIFHSFLERARQEHGSRIQAVAPGALTILQRHHWPGNVRELHNLAEWLTITCKETVVQPHHLPASVRAVAPSDRADPEPKPSLLAFGLSFQDMEKRMLEEALRKTSGNVSEASRLLKITRNTLRYRMAKYHLQPGE
jgi:DNA-binding NtrC family response regulator